MIKKIYNWIVVSSADPTAISLTLKAGIPFIVILAGALNYGDQINENIANEGIQVFVNVLVAVGGVVTAFGTAYGFIRKVSNSFEKDEVKPE